MTQDILRSMNENFTSFLEKIGISSWELINKSPENKALISNLYSSLPLLALECKRKNINSHTEDELWILKKLSLK